MNHPTHRHTLTMGRWDVSLGLLFSLVSLSPAPRCNLSRERLCDLTYWQVDMFYARWFGNKEERRSLREGTTHVAVIRAKLSCLCRGMPARTLPALVINDNTISYTALIRALLQCCASAESFG